MESFGAFMQFCLDVLLEICMVAMTIGQWVIAGEFKWFIGCAFIMVALIGAMVKTAYKDWRKTMK